MSMWQLQPINKDTYNCFQFLTTTIAKFYNCDYRLMMLELWGFMFDSTVNGTIGDKLKLCWNFRTERRKHLLNYHGMSFDIIITQGLDIEQFVHEKLSDCPVAVYIDSYICSWVPFYQKLHRPHALFILDENADTYIFLDQYFKDNEMNKIDKEFVQSNASSIVIFEPTSKGSDIEIDNSVKESIVNWEQYGFCQYESFISDMKNNFNVEVEITSDPVASKLIMYLKNISEDRMNFIEAVNLFEEYFQSDLSTVKNHLTDIARRYEKLRAYIIKCAYSHRGHKTEIIANELDQIYLSERFIYEEIKMLVNKNGEQSYG